MLGFIERHLLAEVTEAERDALRDGRKFLIKENERLKENREMLEKINIQLAKKCDVLHIENNKLTKQNNALWDEMSGVRAENRRIDELYEEISKLKTEIVRLTAALGSEPRVLSEDDIDATFAAVSPEEE